MNKNNICIVDSIADKVKPILVKYGIKRAAIFGSYARGEAGRKSDIDLLVEFSDGIGIVKYMEFKEEVEKVLGKKVDIVSYRWINKYMEEEILKEAIEIYA